MNDLAVEIPIPGKLHPEWKRGTPRLMLPKNWRELKPTDLQRYVRVLTPRQLDAWQTYVNAEVLAQIPPEYRKTPVFTADLPLRVDYVVFLPRNKEHDAKRHPDGLIWKITAPDGDQYLKAVLDALQMPKVRSRESRQKFWPVIHDDARVALCLVAKVHHANTGTPRVALRIRQLHGAPESWILDLDMLPRRFIPELGPPEPEQGALEFAL